MGCAIIYAKLGIDEFERSGFGSRYQHHQNFYLLVSMIFAILCVRKVKVINALPGSDGGIGRRSGLKIHRPQGCASSTLAPSTIESLEMLGA